MKAQDIKYIAFEGGGGKGIVYLGAIRALEAANKLPLSKANREGPNGNSLLDGVAGASAGAITTYFLALGMSADAIDERTKAINKITRKPYFYSFYDDAQPALYKGVTYKAGQGNVPTYIVDIPDVERVTREEVGSPTGAVSVASGISSLYTGKPYVDRRLAEIAAGKMYALYKFVYPFDFIKLAMRALGARKKLKKAGSSNQLAEKLAEKPSDLNKYFYSLLFDRGLFSGIYLREYLHNLTIEELTYNFDVEISLEEAARLTYSQFFAYTRNDLRVAGTNITKNIPVYFSKDLTPHFPIVDSICMSMSIPFAFKPTLSQAWADTNQEYASTNNERYRGFFNDGGTLNNLPIHAFDFEGGQENFMKKVVELRCGMFGIRCTGGNPTDHAEDERFSLDPNYICYLDELNTKNQQGSKKDPKQSIKKPEDGTKTTYQIEMIHRALTPILEFAGNLFYTLMYTSEDGQIRSEQEFKQTMELFSYDVGLFDFTIPPSLSDFVQGRAAIKVGAMLEIEQEEICSLVIDKYYAGQSDENVSKVRGYIKYTYERIQEYKRLHGIDKDG
jgi:NTE family protein